MLKKDGGMKMMEPFSVHGEIPTQTRQSRPCLRVVSRTQTHTLGVKSLSSNLYDGLNNYPAFSAQFVDEPRLE